MKAITKNQDTQYQFLSICLQNPKILNDTLLKKEYFNQDLQFPFQVMKECYESSNALLFEELLSKGVSDDLLLTLTTLENVSLNKDYVKRLESYIIECYQKEEISKISNDLKNEKIDLSDYYKKVKSIQEIKTMNYTRLDYKTLSESITTNKANIRFDIHKILGNRLKLKENDFVILAGRTGTGKTAYALNLVNDLSRNYRILYINLEMAKSELYTRLISIQSNVRISDIEQIKDEDTNNRVESAMKEIDKKNITVISESQTIEKLRNLISNLDDPKEHMIVVIDHLGLLGASGKSLYEKMTFVAKECRKISLDFNCTIIGLCQLARDTKESKSKKPLLYQLKDSGELENSASRVLMIYENEGKYYIDIQKNRGGSCGEFQVNYDKQTQRISEIKY